LTLATEKSCGKRKFQRFLPRSHAIGRSTLAGGVKSADWPKWMRKFKDY